MRWRAFEELWQRAAGEVGERTFLVFEGPDGATETFTYAEMDELVASLAGDFERRGVHAGSAVHLTLANSVGFVATWLACSRLGAWFIPSDPRSSSDELAEHIGRTHPRVGICPPHRAGDYRQAVATASEHAAEAGAPPPDVVVMDEHDTSQWRPDGPRPETAHRVVPSDRLAVMFTSGTTSRPKGVELTQANYAFTGAVMARETGLTRHDRQLVVLPLFHANAQFYSIASAIDVGASVALMHTFSASQFAEQARRHEATHASLFAAPIRMILSRTPGGTAPLSLRHAWFAQNLSSEHYEAITGLLGCKPRQLYGMTETAPAVLVNPHVGSRPTSIGEPPLGCEVRIVRSDTSPAELVDPSEEGEIQIGGYPGLTLFRGYLDDPATTAEHLAETAPDGHVWFRTGDRATIDEDGFHYFAGRGSDVLKVAGENVSVVEIESTLAEHPAIHDVVVVGIPDELRDEVPAAYLVLADGHDPSDADDVIAGIEAFAAERLAPAKRPRHLYVVDELPRTSVGKVRKFLLRPGAAGESTNQSPS